ncbi:peroxisomal acyl-coenzyme A oxidase 3-like [Belonocnema kinseyi]|uniref:peroxisomal acyl-coenzyme A oxidase 3-like n=1 Tax=Belonocnema kinseyi TaxID=2817044 RepID=UPI00143D0365|nr:peroxisomal acyl-coenzyme A oxidase 3-like [Belonocnema kinseyi]
MESIRDLPKGPLDLYRKRASFNWKSFKVHLEGEEFVRSQQKLWNFIEKTPEFEHPKKSLTLDEIRRRCYRQVKAYSTVFEGKSVKFSFLLSLYDGSLPLVRGLSKVTVPNGILDLGTERHAELAKKFIDGKFIGCLSLTEIAHGTNLKGFQTTATYNPQTESFILNTPNFEAAKCWSALLGKTATHALLYANLITPDNVNHGLHPFIVPIRDPQTFLPLPGTTIGDMGEKIGLNGIDNGFMMFKNYSLPRENLLNKVADVTKEGEYITVLSNPSQRFSASLSPLLSGRIGIIYNSTMYLRIALIIAIRYCACRRQFGPAESEWPVIEYQVQQGKLFPHLAALYAWTIFSYNLSEAIEASNKKSKDVEYLIIEGSELHALSSAGKPLSSWTARDAIQDCRETCGGHGYLKASRLGKMRAENDAGCTYEGENTVLIQQTSNWLLNNWEDFLKGKKVVSPFGTANFINETENILSWTFNCSTVEETLELQNLLQMFKWLNCYYLKKTYDKVHNLKKKGNSSFEVKNNSQTYFAHTLSLVYAEHAVVKSFITRIQDPVFEDSERQVLTKLCALFAAWSLEKRLVAFYAGGYALKNSNLEFFIRDGIISICKDLVNEAVSLIDVLAPPDFVVNSPLGMSDGEIYKHLEETFYKDPANFERPSWWREVHCKL